MLLPISRAIGLPALGLSWHVGSFGLDQPMIDLGCGSPPGVIVADTLSFNAKMDLVDF